MCLNEICVLGGICRAWSRFYTFVYVCVCVVDPVLFADLRCLKIKKNAFGDNSNYNTCMLYRHGNRDISLFATFGGFFKFTPLKISLNLLFVCVCLCKLELNIHRLSNVNINITDSFLLFIITYSL